MLRLMSADDTPTATSLAVATSSGADGAVTPDMRGILHMHASRPLKAAAVTVLTSVVAAVAVAGPMAGSALAAKPVASVLPALSSDLTGAVTGQTSVTFTWTTAPPTTETFTCTLDGAASACGTGKGGSKSYGPLAAGTHNFVLRAKQSGHFRSVNASRSWTIDKAPPQAPTVQSVPSPTSNASASVSFTDADPSVDHLLCSVAENSPTSKVIQAEGTCVSPYAVVGPLGTGTYTASVVAVDAAANRSVAGTTTWTVDVTAPGSPVFTTQPANPTNATTASFAWTSDSDVVGTTCSVDGAAAKVCTSPQQLPTVSVGPHSFVVTDTDGLGNRSVGEVDWVVDLTSPVAPSVNGPSNPTDQSSALFSFADVELATTFMCSLDGATFQTCQSPVSYPSLLDGAHHFQVKAVDAAGNTSAPTPYDWTI